MKKRTVIIMTSFLLFGCGPKVSNETSTTGSLMIGGPSGSELAQEQVFRKNNGSDPGTLDPTQSRRRARIKRIKRFI